MTADAVSSWGNGQEVTRGARQGETIHLGGGDLAYRKSAHIYLI